MLVCSDHSELHATIATWINQRPGLYDYSQSHVRYGCPVPHAGDTLQLPLNTSSVLTVFITIIHCGCHLQHCCSADYAVPIPTPCHAGRGTPASPQPFATGHQSPFTATANLQEYQDIIVLLRAHHFQKSTTCIVLYSACITGTREGLVYNPC